MIPAVPFRCPDYFAAVVKVVTIFFATVINEGLTFFLNERTGLSGIADFHHGVPLMPSFVVFIRKGPAVLSPDGFSDVVLFLDGGIVQFDLFFNINKE